MSTFLFEAVAVLGALCGKNNPAYRQAGAKIARQDKSRKIS
jgi:hypothetical protein